MPIAVVTLTIFLALVGVIFAVSLVLAPVAIDTIQDEVIRIYRENIKLVGTAENGYNGPGADRSEMNATDQIEMRDSAAATLGDSKGRPVLRNYAFDISIPREIKGELRITGQFTKDDLARLKRALEGQLAMIEAALED